MTRKLLFYAAGLVLTLALFASAFAGTTGKITGVVKDNQGKPLPGVSVVIEGTRRGAITDADGYYLIISVDPGRYTMGASLIGYSTERKTDVVVASDLTTTVDFKLVEQALQMGEVTVTAERPPVEPDKTSTQYVVSEQDIKNLPIVRDIARIIELTPGASLDGSGRFRGGDNGGGAQDVTFYVDGVRLVNNTSRGGSQFQGINRTAVQEVTVQTGGFNAEYGNAQSGVINIVTKDGTKAYHGNVEYRYTPVGKKHWGQNIYDSPEHRGRVKWSDPNWVNEVDPLTGRKVHERTNYTGIGGHYAEGSLEGPISNRASFFVSGRFTRQANPLPGMDKYGFSTVAGRSGASEGGSGEAFAVSPYQLQGSGKLTFEVSQNVRMKVGALFAGYTAYSQVAGRIGGFAGLARNMNDSGRNLFLQLDSGAGKMSYQDDAEYLIWTHTLNPKTFYEVKLSRYATTIDTSDIPATTTSPRKDKDGWFTIARDVVAWQLLNSRTYNMKVDLSSQVSKSHFLKIGFDVSKYSVWETWFEWPTSLERWIRFVAKKEDAPRPTPGQSYIDLVQNRIKSGQGPLGRDALGTPVKPLQMAFYVQDKMEFEGMVVNLGMRYDRFNVNEDQLNIRAFPSSPMYTGMTRIRQAPRVPGKSPQQWSPRVGISHPITASSTIHFFYGRFFQVPDFWNAYVETWSSNKADQDLNKNGRIDPAEEFNASANCDQFGDLAETEKLVERTSAFEAGADWNFYKDYTGGIVTYYKSANNQVAGAGWSNWTDPVKGVGNFVRYPSQWKIFQDSKGIELSLRKGFSNYFSFRISYTLGWETQGREGKVFTYLLPDSTYVASGNYWLNFDIDPATGAEIPRKLTTKEMQDIGKLANDRIYGTGQRTAVRGGQGYYTPNLFGGELVTPVQQDPVNQPGLWIYNINLGSPPGPKGGDRRNQGSVQFLLATPGKFGPVLGDIRMNVVYKLVGGTAYTFVPPGQPGRQQQGPSYSVADIGFEKAFGSSRKVVPVFFLEVTNLFNDQQAASSGNDYARWGLQLPRPDDKDFINYGDPAGRTRFFAAPRQMYLGFRVGF